MKRSTKLAGMLFALFTTVAAVPAANAAPLLTTGTGSLEQMVAPEYWQETFGGAVYIGQPLANVSVGSSSVTIGGFGVYGQADFASASSPVNVMWVLFAEGAFNGAYSLQQTVTSSGARWFDSPGVALTLAANTTYQMGLVANDTFSWGLSMPGSEVGPTGGLTIQNTMGTAIVTLAGTPGSGFDGIEAIDVYTPYPEIQPSLRIWGADYASAPPPIPEPSEWAMLLAGLMVVAFVAKRQRRRSV